MSGRMRPPDSGRACSHPFTVGKTVGQLSELSELSGTVGDCRELSGTVGLLSELSEQGSGCAYRRFGSLGVLSLASTCKQYATGLAREARRVRARLDAMKVDMMKVEAWRSASIWWSASMLCTGTACTDWGTS